MTRPDDPTVGQGAERLNELAFSFKKSQALAAALEAEIFTAIAAGAVTADAIAEHCGIPAETVDRLLVVCAALGLVEKRGERYRNFDDVNRYLVRSSRTYFGDYLRWTIQTEYAEWANFPENLSPPEDAGAGAAGGSKLYEGELNDPARARAFTEAGYNSSIALAHRLAKRFDFGRYRRWLDFAGGSGCYAIAACERHPGLRVTVLDHPNVVPVTRELIARHGLEARIDARPGDFTRREDFPPGYDLISFVTPLHWYLEEDVVRVLAHAHDALEPGGSVLVVGYMLSENRDGPLDAAFYHLQAIRRGRYVGHVPSGPEYVAYLEAAGFRDARYEWFLSGRLGLIVADK